MSSENDGEEFPFEEWWTGEQCRECGERTVGKVMWRLLPSKLCTSCGTASGPVNWFPQFAEWKLLPYRGNYFLALLSLAAMYISGDVSTQAIGEEDGRDEG